MTAPRNAKSPVRLPKKLDQKRRAARAMAVEPGWAEFAFAGALYTYSIGRAPIAPYTLPLLVLVLRGLTIRLPGVTLSVPERRR